MTDPEFVVVGAGVMGAATAWRLSQRGKEVLLLEQFEVGHNRGSSHGRSRVFRFSYEDPTYVRMAMDALPLWRELEEESGASVLTILGGLDFGGDLTPNVAALRACGADFEFLDPEEAMRRFPGISVPNGAPLLFQPDAGIVAADRAIRAFLDCAAGRGAQLRERTPAVEVVRGGESVEIRTVNETYRPRRLVVTAGGWAAPLLRSIGLHLPVVVTRETVAYFRHEREMELPILVDRGSTFVYSLPDPGHGIKAGGHHTGPPTDPNEPGSVNAGIVALLSTWIGRHYPRSRAEPHDAETCLYTNTSDESFILERHGPVVVGSPCSGHGFKFAPLIGERLARLALE